MTAIVCPESPPRVVVVLTEGIIREIVQQEFFEFSFTEGKEWVLTSDVIIAEKVVKDAGKGPFLFITDDLFGNLEGARNLVNRARAINPEIRAVFFSVFGTGISAKDAKFYNDFVSKGFGGVSFSRNLIKMVSEFDRSLHTEEVKG